MKTKIPAVENLTIGLDLFVGLPASRGHPPFSPSAALRAKPVA